MVTKPRHRCTTLQCSKQSERVDNAVTCHHTEYDRYDKQLKCYLSGCVDREKRKGQTKKSWNEKAHDIAVCWATNRYKYWLIVVWSKQRLLFRLRRKHHIYVGDQNARRSVFLFFTWQTWTATCACCHRDQRLTFTWWTVAGRQTLLVPQSRLLVIVKLDALRRCSCCCVRIALTTVGTSNKTWTTGIHISDRFLDSYLAIIYEVPLQGVCWSEIPGWRKLKRDAQVTQQ